MRDEVSLFLVSSPFQYMCAEEAQHRYKTTRNVLIVEVRDTEIGIRQLSDKIDKSRWSEIIYFERGSRTFFAPKLIKKLKKKYGGMFHRFFFSEYTSWLANTIIVNVNFSGVVYFDDGTMTIIEYDKYIKNKSHFSRIRPIQDFLLYLQGCKPPRFRAFPRDFEMFSIFNFPDADVAVVKNDLGLLRSKMGFSGVYKSDAPVGIIGEGMVGEKGVVSVCDYVKSIEDIVANNRGCIYFPHRLERVDVKAELLKIDGLKYHDSQLPLELEISDKNIKLSAIYGVASTAIYTISVLYSDVPIRLFNLNKHGSDEERVIFEKITSHYEKYHV